MIPHGKLEVHGGNDNICMMTGWYIIEKLDGDGKNVIWNKYGCAPLTGRELPITELQPKEIKVPLVVTPPAVVTEQPRAFQVKVYPNPSSAEFSLQVMSSNAEPISVRIMDATGIVLKVNATLIKGSVVKLGGELKGGTYFAEVIQGSQRQVLRLVKLN